MDKETRRGSVGANRPNLSREIVSAILPHALDHSEQTAPPHGARPADVVDAAGWEWLEAGVLAGHLPHFEGLSLVVRATHMSWLKEVEQAHQAGADGDALGWTEGTGAYRALIALLEDCVREMELERANLLDLPIPSHARTEATAREEQARRDGAAAEAARQRAFRAAERRRSVLRDQPSRHEQRDLIASTIAQKPTLDQR